MLCPHSLVLPLSSSDLKTREFSILPECITLNTEANTQRLDDVQEVNYSFKYYASSSTVTAKTRVAYGNKVYGSGVDSTGLFTAPIGIF